MPSDTTTRLPWLQPRLDIAMDFDAARLQPRRQLGQRLVQQLVQANAFMRLAQPAFCQARDLLALARDVQRRFN
jgi:hypothetical protein